ncbi:MAG: glycosyltransferase family 4 protein [bacterium]|nr:glycosyltransferase family 4 protein [bacterium]
MLLVASVARHFTYFHLPVIHLLQAQGCEVHVACRADGDEGKLAEHGVRTWPVVFRRSPWNPSNLVAFFTLLALMRRQDYRLVHVHTPVASLLGRLAARLTRVPAVLYTAHGFHFYRGAPFLNWLLYYPLEWLAAHWTDGLLAINAEDYQQALRLPVRGKVYRVPGVGVPLPADPGPPQGLTVLAAGDLLANKNLGQLLRAWRHVMDAEPRAMLLIAGEGPQAAGLRSLANQLGIGGQVRFLGFRRDLPELLVGATVVVSASRREGLPRVILEAMAAARPVVVTDVRGHRDLVEDERTGFLVPLGDPEAMAAAVSRLLGEPDLAATMGARARERVAGYAVDRVVQAMEAIYAEWTGRPLA